MHRPKLLNCDRDKQNDSPFLQRKLTGIEIGKTKTTTKLQFRTLTETRLRLQGSSVTFGNKGRRVSVKIPTGMAFVLNQEVFRTVTSRLSCLCSKEKKDLRW